MDYSEGSIKVWFRNQIEVKAGGDISWVGQSLWHALDEMSSPVFLSFFFLSSPPSSRIQSTSWISTSSSVSSQQTAMSHMVTDKDNQQQAM